MRPLFLILVSITLVRCQTKKSGEDIADALYEHPKECKDPSDGGIWAPLAPGHSCGGRDCKYPDQWCSAKSNSVPVPQLNCVNLPSECKKALLKDDAGLADGQKATTFAATTSNDKTSRTHSQGTTSTPETSSSTAATEQSTAPGPPSVEPTEPATTEEIETTTEADSSEEIETTVRTRRPRPIKANPDEAAPRVRHPDEKAGGASVAVAPPPAPEKPAKDCKDGNPFCCFWAGNFQGLVSECDRNALWMRTTCQKSCGTCGCTVSNFRSCKVHVNTEGCPYLPSSPQFVALPVANRGGGGVFTFPTAGGAQGPLVVPVGGGSGAQGPLAVPVGGGLGAQGPLAVPVGGGSGAQGPVVLPVGGGFNGVANFVRSGPQAIPLGNINSAFLPRQQLGQSRVLVGRRRRYILH